MDLVADARSLLDDAIARHREGQLPEAVALYEQVLREEPTSLDALNLLGLALAQGHDHAGAVSAFERGLVRHPAVAVVLVHGDGALRAFGRDAEATSALLTASALAPGEAAVWLDLGAALLDTGAASAAVLALERAASLDPQRAESLNALGCAYVALGRSADAIAAFEAALSLRPGYAAPRDNLARALRTAGRVDEAIARFREALALSPQPGTHSNLLYTLLFSDRVTAHEVAGEHRRWAERWADPLRSEPRPHDLDPERRLRVAYLSPDLNQHAVSRFVEPVLASHDRSAFEVFFYADGPLADATTARLRPLADAWTPVGSLDDEALAARVRDDRIDLLVDLAGHTAHHRLLVFARRPAPVQITWIGYPHGTGLAAMDYRLTDAVSDPPGETDHLYAEALVRLPEAFSCYQPPPDAPAVADAPCTRREGVTFGCFNNLSKMTPSVVAAWSALLAAAPRSRLLLRARALSDADTADRVRRAFAEHGVAPSRLELDPRSLPVPEHLARYAEVDVALDPFPYNGTTTTCEALWMGVPVLTVAGSTHAARVGASLLTHLGLTDWIASDPADLVVRGAALSGDLAALSSLRATLRERMRASPLCDAPRFTAHLEGTYRALWRRRCGA
jgi:predicted O-linked N-acetylglucosamine transferase (SPINDLY family)